MTDLISPCTTWSRKHRNEYFVKCQGSPLLVVMVAVVFGPAAAEQKSQIHLFPPLG